MTTQQKHTIGSLTGAVERFNGKQTVDVREIRKGHIALNIFNVRDLTDVITTTTYVDVEINTKGRVVKGFVRELNPKEEKVYPYMD